MKRVILILLLYGAYSVYTNRRLLSEQKNTNYIVVNLNETKEVDGIPINESLNYNGNVYTFQKFVKALTYSEIHMESKSDPSVLQVTLVSNGKQTGLKPSWSCASGKNQVVYFFDPVPAGILELKIENVISKQRETLKIDTR